MELRSAGRVYLIAAALAAPALAAAVWLVVIEGYRLAQPDSALFRREEPLASLAEAITVCCRVEDAYAFIRAGHDPNAPLTITDPDYAGDGSITVSPLMLAVAAGNGNVVMMLLSSGADPERPENRLAGCLARELGQEEMMGIVASVLGEQAWTACPERAPTDPRPPLRWIVDQGSKR